MFPIGDDRLRGARFAFVNWLFILFNVVVFIYEASLNEKALAAFVFHYGVVPSEITHGIDLWTLASSMFVHGGWMHLIGNMLFLWVFGDNIEAALGHIPYAIFYFLGGLAASAAHILSSPGSDIPSVGASGAIAAVLGAYLVMFPRSRINVLVAIGIYMRVARVTALVFLGIWAMTQFLTGIASLGATTAQTSGVAWWAHIGGFVFGLIAGGMFRSRAAKLEIAEA